jgi:PAS domain S-box-containing protein
MPLHQMPHSASSLHPVTPDCHSSDWLSCWAGADHASAVAASQEAAVFSLSAAGAITSWNPGAAGLFGYSPAEVIGQSMSLLVARGAGDAFAALHASALEGSAPTSYTSVVHARKDGSQFVASVIASPMTVEGSTVGVVFAAHPTSALGAECEHVEARATSEMKFAAAFASTSDAINITRIEDGVYVEVNEGFCRMTGYTPEDVVGRSVFELGIWADVADRSRMVERLMADGYVSDFEAAFRYRDGRVCPGSMSARVIDIGGEPHILSVTRDISDQKRAAEELESSNARLAHMLQEMTATLGRIVESRDPYTHGHQERVSEVSRAIAEEMGLPERDVEAVAMAALVHDIGKLSVPAEILNKPGVLSEVEFSLIKTHSERGHAILGGVESPWPLADVVWQHHERKDGSGYPQGLKGDAILLPARILAIADVVEAMASHRPYRPALGLEAAVQQIRNHPEKYDDDARAACLRLYESGALNFLDENFSAAQATGA